jgi:hypothetical protein
MVNASGNAAGRAAALLDPPLDSGRRRARALILTAASTALLFVGCGEEAPDVTMTVAQLTDPSTCKECHLQHYQEWSASMHAYASKDPVFLAMNRRGQEETKGELGSFCVKCHAPMAVALGVTTDGLNLDQVPDALQGVTCYFCHNAAAVEGTHNNPIRLANDTTMRGGFKNPVKNPAHRSEYASLMSGASPESAKLCGSCHDIVLPSPPAPPPANGEPVKLERTYSEWQSSIFGNMGDGGAGLPCASCHMVPSPAPFKGFGPAAEKPGLAVGSRNLHEHLFPGVDVAFARFPETSSADDDEFLAAHHRERIQYFLNSTVQIKEICVHLVEANRTRITVTMENVGAGHFWPSGASHDRRAWVEVKAYVDGQDTPVYQSGVIADDEDITKLGDRDPDLWLFRDELRGTGDKEPHMFWDVIESKPNALPVAVTLLPTKPEFYANHVERTYPLKRSAFIPAPPDRARLRVTVRVRLQPMGFDVLDDVIASGHLDPAIRAKMPIFSLYPNAVLAKKPEVIGPHPELRRLAEVSFEWSEAVRESGRFDEADNFKDGAKQDCLLMKNATP